MLQIGRVVIPAAPNTLPSGDAVRTTQYGAPKLLIDSAGPAQNVVTIGTGGDFALGFFESTQFAPIAACPRRMKFTTSRNSPTIRNCGS